MMYLKLRNGRVKIGPADRQGEREIREVVRILQQIGLKAFEIETELDDIEHDHHRESEWERKRNQERERERERQEEMRRYGYDQHQTRQYPQRHSNVPQMYDPYGYGIQSLMPMRPDFQPEAHFWPHYRPQPPVFFPIIIEREGMIYSEGGGSGGGGRGGRRGGSRSAFDEYDFISYERGNRGSDRSNDRSGSDRESDSRRDGRRGTSSGYQPEQYPEDMRPPEPPIEPRGPREVR